MALITGTELTIFNIPYVESTKREELPYTIYSHITTIMYTLA